MQPQAPVCLGGWGGGVERAAQGRLRASQTRSLGIEPDKNDLHRIWGFGGVGGETIRIIGKKLPGRD